MESRKKILIVEACKPVSTILTLFLQSFFENEMLLANSSDEAIEIVQEEGENLGVIFVDNIISGGSGFNVYESIKKMDQNIPFFLISASPAEHFNKHFGGEYPVTFKVIPKPFNKEDILACAKIFMSSNKPQFEGFRKIKTECIEFLDKGQFNYYLKLSDDKLVPISTNDKEDIQDTIKKYSEKGVAEFFLKKEDFELALSKSLKHISRKLVEKDPELKDRIVFQLNSIENIHSNLKKIGMKSETIELSQKTLEMTIDNIKQEESILRLLETLGEEENFIFELGMLTSSISTAIASFTNWGNNKNLQILSTASILQDISLKDPHLARISCLQDPEFSGLLEAEKETIKGHPEKSIDLIDKVKDLDPMVKSLILQHHELPLGDGFPKGVDANKLPEISCVYILSHFYAQNLLKFPPSRALLLCLNETIKEEFSSGHFTGPFESFKKAFNLEF